ncbi:MAG: hypothetical protein KF842_06920 [Caulobacter sp.]|nr:hypothetical protein [Caulobacter sp.]
MTLILNQSIKGCGIRLAPSGKQIDGAAAANAGHQGEALAVSPSGGRAVGDQSRREISARQVAGRFGPR